MSKKTEYVFLWIQWNLSVKTIYFLISFKKININYHTQSLDKIAFACNSIFLCFIWCTPPLHRKLPNTSHRLKKDEKFFESLVSWKMGHILWRPFWHQNVISLSYHAVWYLYLFFNLCMYNYVYIWIYKYYISLHDYIWYSQGKTSLIFQINSFKSKKWKTLNTCIFSLIVPY